MNSKSNMFNLVLLCVVNTYLMQKNVLLKTIIDICCVKTTKYFPMGTDSGAEGERRGHSDNTE